MEQRDFLLRQVDNLTKALTKLLTSMLRLKDKNPAACLTVIQQTLQENSLPEIKDMVNYSDEEFINFFLNKNLVEASKVSVAQIIELIVQLDDNMDAKKYLSRALLIYELIIKDLKPNFSIEIDMKVKALREKIDRY